MTVRPLESLDDFLAQLDQALGEKPVLAPPSALKYLGEMQKGQVTLKEFQYVNGLNETVGLTVAEPEIRRWAHPVIAVHQTNTCGRREVFAQGGNPFLAYGLALAERGHRVFAIDLAWTGERQSENPWNYDSFYQRYANWTVAGRDVTDLTGLADLLQRSFGETEAPAIIGHSQGGLVALFFAAVTGRVSHVVANASYFSSQRSEPRHPQPLYTSRFLIERPGQLSVGNHMDLLVSAATRMGRGLIITYQRDSIIPDPVPRPDEIHRMGLFSNNVWVACVDLEHLFPAVIQALTFAFLEDETPDWPSCYLHSIARKTVLADGLDQMEYLYRELRTLLEQKERQRAVAEDHYARLLADYRMLQAILDNSLSGEQN